MVKSVINGITTYYAFSSYVVEVDGSDTTIRKTYIAGSTSIAIRTIVNGTQDTLNWSQVPSLLIIQRRHSAPPKRSGRGLLSDHTSTGSVEPWVPPPLPPQPTVASGFDIIIKSSREALPKWNVGSTWFSELRYSAFGRKRFQNYSFNETAQHPWNEMEGAKRAIPLALRPHPNGCRRTTAIPPYPPVGGRVQTGQLQQADINLYYYNARYYDPALGRFVQSDTIVPQPYSVQGYDRYAYVNNNPLRYTDPSGHNQDCGINDPYCNNTKHEWVNSEWPEQLSYDVFWSAKDSYHYYYNNPEEAFTDMYLEEESDDTLYASIYSEYVLHSTFDPIPEFMYMDKLLLARQAGNAFVYYTIMGSMTLAETFEQASFGTNFSEGVNSKNYDPGNPGSSHSGRWGAFSLKEQLAMEEVMADPLSNSIILPLKMNDTKRGWTEAEGWVKVSKTVNSVEIHFIYNTRTGAFADFKFK